MDLNDYPTGRLFAWKPALLIAGGMVFLILLIFILVRVFSGDSSEERLLQNLTTPSDSSVDACDDTDNPEKCRAAYISDLAQQQLSTQACDLLETDAQKDNCYWGLAQATHNPDFCEPLLEAESKTRCIDGVFFAQAKAAKNAQPCDSIQTPSVRNRCEQLFVSMTSAQCVSTGEDSVVCDDIALFETAREEQSSVYCKEIVDESTRDNCLDFFASTVFEDSSASQIDTDQDGLTDLEEQTYGSDPQNPDSDGDGYLDGAEVSSGYDPTGPGILSQS